MRFLPLITPGALFISACLSASVVRDPHAVAPEYDRWEARLGAERGSVFAAALDVLADSGFSVRNADPASGIIATNHRSRSIGGSTNDYRLDFMILPAGDSVRLVLSGEICLIVSGARQCYTRRATGNDWRVVQGIGEAILLRFGRTGE